MSELLLKLRGDLEALDSYRLPEHYNVTAEDDGGTVGNHDSTFAGAPLVRKSDMDRYRSARDAYIRKRVEAVLLQQVGTYDGQTFELPPPPSVSEVEALERREHATRELIHKTQQVCQKSRLVQAKYESLAERREELRTILTEMEQAEQAAQDQQAASEAQGEQVTNSTDEDDDVTMDEDDDVDEEEMALQEDTLAQLIQKRSELEGKLRTIRVESKDLEDTCAHTKSSIQNMQTARSLPGLKPPQAALPSPATLPLLSITPQTLQDLEQKTLDLRKKVKENKEMAEWYDSVRGALEELGGIKILGVEYSTDVAHADSTNNIEDKENASNGAPNKKSAITSSKNKDEVIVRLMLLGRHVLHLGLGSPGTTQKRGSRHSRKKNLRVSSATIVTPTLLTETSCSEDANEPMRDAAENPTVQMHIPPLDDLVKLSLNLGPEEDVRFVVREAMTRIRTISARVRELATLRTKYLTKIGKSTHSSFGFGGEEQEIVCTLNAGVTVVLRLSPDCPILEGSVYMDQIVGIGGWDAHVLDSIRDTVTADSYMGPLALMDALVQEIERVEKEDGISMPRTPKLPTKQRTLV